MYDEVWDPASHLEVHRNYGVSVEWTRRGGGCLIIGEQSAIEDERGFR